MRMADEKVLPQLWKGIEGSSETQTCFTCHGGETDNTTYALSAPESVGYWIHFGRCSSRTNAKRASA